MLITGRKADTRTQSSVARTRAGSSGGKFAADPTQNQRQAAR